MIRCPRKTIIDFSEATGVHIIFYVYMKFVNLSSCCSVLITLYTYLCWTVD